MPHFEHLIDWFHLRMRLSTMSRLAQGVRAADYPELSADLKKRLDNPAGDD